MSEKLYSLPEVEALTGIPEATLRKQLNRDPSLGVKAPISPGSKRLVWKIPESLLNLKEEKGNRSKYDQLVEQWEAEQASGYHTGKPIGEIAINLNTTGLKDFWRHLGKEPDLSLLTPDNLKRSITSIEVNYEARNCHYSKKLLIYKGVISFLKILVRHNLMTEALILEFKKAKPKRVFPPRKTVLQDDMLERFLEANRKLKGGRSEFDVAIGEALIGTMAYAGLRRKELIQLGLHDVDLKKGLISVIDGKGHKDRIVGISIELEKMLKSYLLHRPRTESSRFFVQESGEPITKFVIQHRIHRLAKNNDIDITPHGLRRTFATRNSNKGIPLDKLRLQLGHTKLETTQGYLMTDEMEAAMAIRGERPKVTYDQLKEAVLKKKMLGK
jgi:integrase